MILCDMHTHSNNSFDAKNTVDDMCKSAVSKGLYAISITDHCEAPEILLGDACEYGDFDVLIPKSFKESKLAQEKYSSKLKVLCGLELGEPMHNLSCTQKALGYGDFDFILASVHNLRNMQDFYFLDYQKLDADEILNLYFDELAETATFNNYDSLAHLTYPLRYIKEKTGKIPDLSKYQDKIDNIYNILIKNNKALEINVSGLYKGFGFTLPDEIQIKRFKQLGGKYITIGSDSHNIDDVGKCIEQGMELAKKCGFTHYTIFEKRKPVSIEL